MLPVPPYSRGQQFLLHTNIDAPAFPLQLKDKYGSPSLDEISIFSREFYRALEAELGEQAAGKLSVEVSSPVRLSLSSTLPRQFNMPEAELD